MGYAYFIYYIYIILASIYLICDNRKTSSTIAWLMIFIFFPPGVLLYIVFGKDHRIVGKRGRLTELKLTRNFSFILHKLIDDHDEIIKKSISEKNNKLITLLDENSYSLLSENNDVRIIQDGEEKFNLLMDDVKNAKSFIHMAYFIWREDELTLKFKDILIKKAQEGLEVRILIDAVGSYFLSTKYIKELSNAGVKIYHYFDFSYFFSLHTINYRNHRKIVVIDGTIGYTGGMNMGKEYVDGAFGHDCWRDTHLRIVGESVKSLNGVFAFEWETTTEQKIYEKKYFPQIKSGIGNTKMQITVSGPDSKWESIKQMYFEMICSAKKNVYIQTPYFVPDESLIDAMKTAALSGRDVKIMVTGVPDKKIPYWVAFTYFKELLDAGVKIYHYNRCFLHSKTIVTDSEIAAVGTANFDIRSFSINYELMAVLYDKKLSVQLEKDFEADLKHCSEMTVEKYNDISRLSRFRNSAARLMSPIL